MLVIILHYTTKHRNNHRNPQLDSQALTLLQRHAQLEETPPTLPLAAAAAKPAPSTATVLPPLQNPGSSLNGRTMRFLLLCALLESTVTHDHTGPGFSCKYGEDPSACLQNKDGHSCCTDQGGREESFYCSGGLTGPPGGSGNLDCGNEIFWVPTGVSIKCCLPPPAGALGAIIGGSVGGGVFLCCVCGIVVALVMRNNAAAQRATAPPTAPPQVQGLPTAPQQVQQAVEMMPQPMAVAVPQPMMAVAAPEQVSVNIPQGGMKFDPNTGQPIPKFDPNTGKQNW